MDNRDIIPTPHLAACGTPSVSLLNALIVGSVMGLLEPGRDLPKFPWPFTTVSWEYILELASVLLQLPLSQSEEIRHTVNPCLCL